MWLSIDSGDYLSDVDFIVKSESVSLPVVTCDKIKIMTV